MTRRVVQKYVNALKEVGRIERVGGKRYASCKNCGKQFDLSVKKCPECGGKLKKQFTEEELEEIKKQNDDFTAISNFMF